MVLEGPAFDEAAFDLVIFDCDGVLVDSERIANAVFADLLSEAGLATTLEESVERYMGRSMPSALALAEEALGAALPSDLATRYAERIFALFDASLEAVPGVVAALDAIALPTCVASSGDHERIRRALGQTGLLARFDGRIFSAADVARGKPFPDLFLHAATAMGVEPPRCAVVEDSPAGVEAAVAAGMTAFGYGGMTPSARLVAAGATSVFDDMTALPSLVTTGS